MVVRVRLTVLPGLGRVPCPRSSPSFTIPHAAGEGLWTGRWPWRASAALAGERIASACAARGACSAIVVPALDAFAAGSPAADRSAFW